MAEMNLPEGWVETVLSELVSVIRGITYNKNQSANIQTVGMLPVLRANNIQNGDLIFDDLVYVRSELIKEQQFIKSGDIVVAMSSGSKALVGKTAQAKIDFNGGFGAFCGVLRPKQMLNKNLISWFTCSSTYRNRISELSAGANINNLKPSSFDEIPFPLPPLAEQKVIADQLDSLLAQVERTTARLERIPTLMKQFRQSVLAHAVSGKLTEGWRAKNQLEQWQSVFLDSLIIEPTNGLSKRTGNEGVETTILRLADFKDAVRVYGNERKILLNSKEIDKYSLINGDILIIRVNGSADLAGKFIEYKGDSIEGFCDHFIRIRINKNKIIPKYLTFVANEGDGRYYLKANLSTSAGQNTINQGAVKGLTVPLPALEEQSEIVHRVETLFAHADSIEQQAKAGLERVNQLTQSILAKAFRGELTAQWRKDHPELISGENSAEALLERIKAERTEMGGKKKRGKAKD
jgi:type I restriction enzyme S subunit